MSGPKVVTIVTREEIIAICEGMIASLEAAFQHWERVGTRNQIISAEDREMVVARIKAMRHLLATDQFEALQKQVPREIGFLQTDIEKRIEAAAEKAVQVKLEGKRRIRAARTLADALGKKGITVSPALQRPETLSNDALNRALSEAFDLLTGSAGAWGTTDRQRELAAKLGADETRLTLAQWLDTQPHDAGDRAVTQLLKRYAELQSYDPRRAATFEGRIDLCVADQSERRGLLLDSLALDMGEARRIAVEIASVTQVLTAAGVELEATLATETIAIAAQIRQALAADTTLSELKALETVAQALIEKSRAERADRDRRNAVLQGLAELGYQVQEGMQTAWIENGRVVLRSSKSAQYGVELGGDPSKAMQVRTVAFGEEGSVSNPAADIAAETEFCGDFSKLQKRLAANGGNLSIVKALGVGATPVKRMVIGLTPSQAVEVPMSRSWER